MLTKEQAQNFSEQVTLALLRNRRAGRSPASITALARQIGCARETVSRALNRDEFPTIRAQISTVLGL